jgi:hypothetical protein
MADNNKNMPAFPVTENIGINGVTKREWMAAHVNVANELENLSIGFIKELMGKEPPAGTMENHAYWNEAEAKLRVMKADAILTELSKA